MNLYIKETLKYFFIFIFVCFPYSESFSQNMVKQISNVDGLSSNSVNCFLEDSEHVLWIGTWDGLNAYNGRDIKIYRHNKNDIHSISNSLIRRIVEQDSTYLWISTGHGLNRWNRETQIFEHFFEGEFPLIAVTPSKYLICCVGGTKLFYYDAAKQKFTLLKYILEHRVKQIMIDSSNNLFLLTSQNELLKYEIIDNDDAGLSLSKFVYIEKDEPIRSIVSSDDLLVMDYGYCLKVLNITKKEINHIEIPQGKVIQEMTCNNKYVFASLEGGGCLKYDLENKISSLVRGIPDNISVFSLYAGSQDILWFGTDGQGVLSAYEYNSSFTTVDTNYPVRSFCEYSKGRILVGTKGEGIKKLNKYTGEFYGSYTTQDNLLSNSIYSMKKNVNGDIFIGSEGAGINFILNNESKIRTLDIPMNAPSFSSVYSMYFTNQGTQLWLATVGSGLIRIHLKKQGDRYIAEQVKQYTTKDGISIRSNNIIYSIVRGENENVLWLGTRGGGINKFNIETEIIEQVESTEKDPPLSNNDVLSMQNGDDNSLWVGTAYGLNHLSFKEGVTEIVEYIDVDGLMNNTIHGVIQDINKNLWVSTSYGISLLDATTKSMTSYTSRDGLQNDEFSDGGYYVDSESTLYFGGVNGVTYFKSDEIRLRDHMPSVRLGNLRINNVNQNIHERIKDGALKLSPDEPYATLTFVVNDFINNENCEIKYSILNFADEWINNENNPNIILTKLPPGKYQLMVKSTNGDRVWSDKIYTLNIDVAYPWWRSTLAYIIYFVLLAATVYIIQSVIRNRMRLNRELLLKNIEKQHQQSVHESKLNFFTNVAHEFFTPLTLIYGPAQHLLEKSELDAYSKRYIQVIKNNAERIQKLIGELMEFRKVESGHTKLYAESINIKLLMEYITDNYTEIAEENRITFNITSDNVSVFITDRNSLEKIIFNLISNAFKYSPTGGSIDISIDQDQSDGGELKFCIRNSCKGLTDDQMKNVFSRFTIFENNHSQNTKSIGIGLNLTKSLVELLGGNIRVSSVLGEYVEFNFEIKPIGVLSDENVNVDAQSIDEKEFLIGEKDVSILVVEDEKNIRELLKDILKPYYNVSGAENGRKGIEELSKNIPDIIITDILMPDVDGIELMSHIKADEKMSHIPIISISAKDSTEDHINAYQHGADIYITKPFHPRHVLVAVENVINKHSLLKKYFNSSRSSLTVRGGVSIHKEDELFLQEIVAFVENNIDDESLSPNSISDFIGISKASLYRKMNELADKTPSEFVRTIRLQYASRLLKTTKDTVSEIMFKSGFSNKSYFYREFSKMFGTSPNEYRKEHLLQGQSQQFGKKRF